jgi:hypothetical protein
MAAAAEPVFAGLAPKTSEIPPFNAAGLQE